MYVCVLDDSGLLCAPDNVAVPMLGAVADAGGVGSLDRWFEQWSDLPFAAKHQHGGSDGVFLIHAHARVTSQASRQDLEGVEVLKHIRLSPWLGDMRDWHAVVCSFEPLTHILRRRPGQLILTSPGVTFLRLPDAMDLKQALLDAYPADSGRWQATSVEGILAELGRNRRAPTAARRFRSYVACDYVPPDSEHHLSNWWGIFEMLLALRNRAPDRETLRQLPSRVRDFVVRLDSKKARYLDGEDESSATAPEASVSLEPARMELAKTAAGKTVVYVDDEAGNGWSNLFGILLDGGPGASSGSSSTKLILPSKEELLRLRPVEGRPSPKENGQPAASTDRLTCPRRVAELVDWILSHEPHLLVLDLRLLGTFEAERPPHQASGMDVAREIRKRRTHLPILLFTASNKAETVMIVRSLEIDDYWMKPGLGEHRGVRSAQAELQSLAIKLTTLLGHRYGWLTRAADAVEDIARRGKSHWWERRINWPGPVPVPASMASAGDPPPPASEIQDPEWDVHQQVLGALRAMLQTTRILFRLTRATATAHRDGVGLHATTPSPASASFQLSLRLSLFVQIGLVVELVHATERRDAFFAPFNVAAANGRIGGFGDRRNPGSFVFRRCDWWAFRLYALRNTAAHDWGRSHATPLSTDTVIGDDALMRAISDLLAWLTARRPTLAPLSAADAATLASTVGTVVRLHPDDPLFVVTMSSDRRRLDLCTTDVAVTPAFRIQLSKRTGYAELVAKSDALLQLLPR